MEWGTLSAGRKRPRDKTHGWPAGSWHSAPKAGQRAWTVPNRNAVGQGSVLFLSKRPSTQSPPPKGALRGRGCTLQNTLNLKTNENWSQADFTSGRCSGTITSLLVPAGPAFPYGAKSRPWSLALAGAWKARRQRGGGVHPGPRCLGRRTAGGLLCRARTDSARDKWLLSTYELNAFNLWPSGLSGSLICPGQ